MSQPEPAAQDEARSAEDIARRRKRKRAKRPIGERILRSTAVLPAAFTLFNGLAGFAAIHFAAKAELGVTLLPGRQALGNLQLAALLIFFAMFCDMLDGRLARMTRSTSDFGAQLDSLCDAVSFGVAPAFLMSRMTVSLLRDPLDVLPVERLVWCIAGLYVACAILRLARFNVETDQAESAHMDFRGLPSPGAAAGVASLVLLYKYLLGLDSLSIPESQYKDWVHWGMCILLPMTTLLAALLMVSRIRYPHIVNQYIRGRRPFSYLVKFVIILLACVVALWPTLAVVVLIYILSGPLQWLWLLLRRNRRAAEE